MKRRVIQIPEFVRIKPGALDRIGVYLQRAGYRKVAVFSSLGLVQPLRERLRESCDTSGVVLETIREVREPTVEEATALFAEIGPGIEAVVGLGGGKALDTAKYVASLANLPYWAVPSSVSNDGFCSPQASLILGEGRRSISTGMPSAVIVDTQVCLEAPISLWCSGVGDLAAKITAIRDWKMAFHDRQVPVNDFAALLSDATVHQFIGRPEHDLEGAKLLATALMLNGVAMEICGSSRPASGSEHLISHALDRVASRPRLHGLQVGVATYVVSHLQNSDPAFIADLFSRTGFWDVIRDAPFSRNEWLQAVEMAPTVKQDYYTVLSARNCLSEVKTLMDSDRYLRNCFTD